MICGFGTYIEGRETCLSPFCRTCNRCYYHCQCDARDFRDEIEHIRQTIYLRPVAEPECMKDKSRWPKLEVNTATGERVQ